MDTTRCETCVYWVTQYAGNRIGSCRRRSPSCGATVSNWPLTNHEDWCGEYAESLTMPQRRLENDAQAQAAQPAQVAR